MEITNRILNNCPVKAQELRIGNLINIGFPRIVTGISEKAVECVELYGAGECQIFSIDQISGYSLLQGQKGLLDMIYRDNDFIKESEITLHKSLVDGTKILLQHNYYKDLSILSYLSFSRSIFFVHEFQNLYYTLLNIDLIVNHPPTPLTDSLNKLQI